MRQFFYVLFIITLGVLWIIAAFRSIPTFFYNLFNPDKRRYWRPSDWLVKGDYDPKKDFF